MKLKFRRSKEKKVGKAKEEQVNIDKAKVEPVNKLKESHVKNWSTDKKSKLFEELKSSLNKQLQDTNKFNEDLKEFKERGSVAMNDAIVTRKKIREQADLMTKEWNEMNKLYVAELRKRKSRFTKTELDAQQAD